MPCGGREVVEIVLPDEFAPISKVIESCGHVAHEGEIFFVSNGRDEHLSGRLGWRCSAHTKHRHPQDGETASPEWRRVRATSNVVSLTAGWEYVPPH